jgi:lysophospholipase L1-like esterase
MKVKAIQNGQYDLLLIGNSIIQNLNESGNEWDSLKPVWDKYFASRNAINLGFSGYRTEQILWNMQNGQLNMQESPEVAILLIGTNNLDDQHYPVVHTAEQVFNGIKTITGEIRHRHPTTRILILSPFIAGGPDDKTSYHRKYNRSRKCRDALLKVGKLVKQFADNEKVYSLDLNHVFLNPDGSINPDLMPDLIHPNGPGTWAWVRAMEPTLSKLMGDQLIR